MPYDVQGGEGKQEAAPATVFLGCEKKKKENTETFFPGGGGGGKILADFRTSWAVLEPNPSEKRGMSVLEEINTYEYSIRRIGSQCYTHPVLTAQILGSWVRGLASHSGHCMPLF
jgi:hypothetical protein